MFVFECCSGGAATLVCLCWAASTSLCCMSAPPAGVCVAHTCYAASATTRAQHPLCSPCCCSYFLHVHRSSAQPDVCILHHWGSVLSTMVRFCSPSLPLGLVSAALLLCLGQVCPEAVATSHMPPLVKLLNRCARDVCANQQNAQMHQAHYQQAHKLNK